MKPTESAVVIAKGKVHADIELDGLPLEPIHVGVGQPVHVRFPYRIDETSKLQEKWTFTLVTRHGDEPERVVQRRHKDRFMITDAVWALVEDVWTFDAPGAYTIDFEADVKVESTPWVDDSMAPEVRRRTVVGAIDVIVGES